MSGEISLSEAWHESFGYPYPVDPKHNDLVAYNVEAGQVILMQLENRDKGTRGGKVLAIYVKAVDYETIYLLLSKQRIM